MLVLLYIPVTNSLQMHACPACVQLPCSHSALQAGLCLPPAVRAHCPPPRVCMLSFAVFYVRLVALLSCAL